MLLNESPKSNPTPTWSKTIREFIFMGILPATIATGLYFFHSKNIYLGIIQIVTMVLAAKATLFFIAKIIRMNIDDKRK